MLIDGINIYPGKSPKIIGKLENIVESRENHIISAPPKDEEDLFHQNKSKMNPQRTKNPRKHNSF